MNFIRKGFARVLTLALCAVCVLTLLQPALSVDPVNHRREASYAVMVQNSPYAGAMSIGQMENGTKLTVLEETTDYYKVDCYGRAGYIEKRFVTANKEYYVNCGAKTEGAFLLNQQAMAETISQRGDLLERAKAQLGTPYVYGGSRPGGFDCSGFVYYLYEKLGVELNRCADAQMENGLVVTKDGLQVGDLVFFRDPGSPWLASHVGMYAGEGKMIHAGSNGSCYTDLDTPYYASRYVGARRILNADATEIQQLPTAAAKAALRTRSLGLRTTD